jgi:hypothetical protein
MSDKTTTDKRPRGRPRLHRKSAMEPIGPVAMTPDQRSLFSQLSERCGGKAQAVRYLIDHFRRNAFEFSILKGTYND